MEKELSRTRFGNSSVDADGLRPGNVLAGRFRLLECIGGGQTCEIWHAEDMSLGREVAIKTARVSQQADPQVLAGLLHEGKLLAQLQHAGVLPIHDVGSDRGVVFLVTQLVRGRALDEVLSALAARATHGPGDLDAGELQRILAGDAEPEPGPPSLRSDPSEDWFHTSAKVISALLLSLEAVHDRDIIHRDLKPANVMLMPTGQPILVDFGFGGHRSDLTTPGFARLSCTPNYVAPEQLAHMSTGQDVRTDIYQAGLILYELLTLKKCFAGETSFDLYDRIVGRRFEVPGAVDRRVPRSLETVCLKAIALAPRDRYPSAAAFRADIQRFLDGSPVRAATTRSPASRAENRPPRGGKLLRFFAVAPLLGLLASLVRVWLHDV